MYTIIKTAKGHDIVGIDGDIIATRTTKMAAQEAAKAFEEAYYEAIVEEGDLESLIKDAVEEATNNMVVMTAEDHNVIQEVANEAMVGRDRHYNKNFGTFTEVWKPRDPKDRGITQEEFRASMGWEASSLKRPQRQQPERKVSSDAQAWARKIKEAVKV